MTEQYYACDWIIRSATNYQLLLETIKKLGGQLMILKLNQETREGFIYNTFAIKVYSKNVLTEFVETAGRVTGMMDWYPISAADFTESRRFPEPLEDYSSQSYLRWLDGMNQLGKINEKLRQEIDGNSQT